MKFPELKIIDQFTSNKQQESIYTVFIDWKEVDNYKIKSRKNWYNKYGIEKPSDIEKKALKQCIKEMDWKSEFLYPVEYNYIFEKYSKFNIPKSYYDECVYLKEMALKEYNRPKPFDTMVRESLMEISEQYVASYFFMIYDSIGMYNDEYLKDPHFEKILLRILLQYRFWKHQTGSGLVIKKSLDFTVNEIYNDDIKEVKNILNKNLEFEPFGLSTYYPDRHEQLREIIKSYIRDNQINNILL